MDISQMFLNVLMLTLDSDYGMGCNFKTHKKIQDIECPWTGDYINFHAMNGNCIVFMLLFSIGLTFVIGTDL